MKTDEVALMEWLLDEIKFDCGIENGILSRRRFVSFMDLIFRKKEARTATLEAFHDFTIKFMAPIGQKIMPELQERLRKAVESPELEDLRSDYSKLAKFESLTELREEILRHEK